MESDKCLIKISDVFLSFIYRIIFAFDDLLCGISVLVLAAVSAVV